MKIVGANIEKMKIIFLSELPLILRIGRKRKKLGKDISKGIPNIECERDWPVGKGATLSDGQKIKNNFSSFRDFFRGKPIVSYC